METCHRKPFGQKKPSVTKDKVGYSAPVAARRIAVEVQATIRKGADLKRLSVPILWSRGI